MIVCVRENTVVADLYYIFGDKKEELLKPPYNYQFVEIDNKYKDCTIKDFELVKDKYQFNIDKYNQRKLKERNLALELSRINEIQARLNQLSQDFMQASLGAIFEDLEERMNEFKTLHNELRVLQGKEPRIYE